MKENRKEYLWYGEGKVCDMFTKHIKDELGYKAYAPYSDHIQSCIK